MLKQLTNRVYYLPHVSETDRPALGFITGDRCSLVVDGGNSAIHASEFMKEIDELNLPPVKYLAVTHWHWDHVFGMDEIGASSIANRLANDKLRWMQTLSWDDESIDQRVCEGSEIPFSAENIKKEHPHREFIRVKTADIEYERALTIDLGAVTCSIFLMGGEHSEDSAVIYVPEERVLFLGDGLCHDMFSGEWSYDLDNFKERIAKIIDLPCDWFVNSHWPPQTRQEFIDWVGYMELLGQICVGITEFEAAHRAYQQKSGTPADQETLFLLDSFVWGNRKKQRK